ncbi:hypothetical protein AB0E96_35805, partial [Kitasatospora sp. NPDC036755]
MVKPIPDGYAELTAYLSVADADAAIAFYTRAFGADKADDHRFIRSYLRRRQIPTRIARRGIEPS